MGQDSQRKVNVIMWDKKLRIAFKNLLETLALRRALTRSEAEYIAAGLDEPDPTPPPTPTPPPAAPQVETPPSATEVVEPPSAIPDATVPGADADNNGPTNQ